MAVAFNVPVHEENGDGSSSSSQSPNTTNSATQTPLQSPVCGEHLVQAFCEALYRCSMNGSPGFQIPPPSPSCSAGSPNASQGGEVFFPRSRSTPRSPRSSFGDKVGFFRYPRPQRANTEATRRSRLTSTGDDNDEHQSEHETSWDELEGRYENFTAARDRLQEFPGRIPPRKKKKDTSRSKPKTKESSSLLNLNRFLFWIWKLSLDIFSRDPTFNWPTVVTVFVVAMSCGFLAAR